MLIRRGFVKNVLPRLPATRLCIAAKYSECWGCSHAKLPGESCFEWLRMIADHLAAAIANARAMEEIESLKKRLEQENEYLREEVQQSAAFGDLIGQAPALQAVDSSNRIGRTDKLRRADPR